MTPSQWIGVAIVAAVVGLVIVLNIRGSGKPDDRTEREKFEDDQW